MLRKGRPQGIEGDLLLQERDCTRRSGNKLEARNSLEPEKAADTVMLWTVGSQIREPNLSSE